MYKTAYAQEAMSSATIQRSQEYELFQQAIEMLEAAEAEGVGSMVAAKASMSCPSTVATSNP